MNKDINRFRGFTLFEVMLLLIVASIVAVAAMRYAKHQQEVAADQIYGLKLYTFGQAVSDYIASAGDLQISCQLPGPAGTSLVTLTNCTEGGTGTATLTATGVTWLYPSNAGTNSMGNPFLPQGFSFAKDLSPLQMGTVNSDGSMGSATGDKAIVTTVTFTQGPTPGPVTISVQTGGLFETQGMDSKGKPLPPVLMPALTQDAITHANTLYSASLGAAAINYTFPYLPAGGGSPKPSNVTGTLTQNTGAAYLEVKGSNAGGNNMMGTINFDPSAAANAAVTGVNQVGFVSSDLTIPSTVTNANQLSFFANAENSQMGVMALMRVLNFAGSTLGGTINNVQQLNFDTSPAALNLVITGVDSIGFRQSGAGLLEGLTVLSPTTACVGNNNNACDTGVVATVNGLPASACFIGEADTLVWSGCDMHAGDKTQTGSSGCGVSIGSNGHWYVNNTGGTESSSAWGSGGYNSTCSATCLIWSTAALGAAP